MEYVKAQKEKKRDKKKVIIKSIDVNDKFRKRVVCLTKGDRDYINKEVERAFRNKWISRKNVIKIKRVLAMLIYLSRKCEDDKGRCRIRKMDNVPNEITDLTLEKLTGVGHKNMDAYIALFENMDVVQSTIRAGETKISVLFSNHPGDVWFETEDYNKAGTMIRDYYRVEDAVNLPKKKKLKRFRKK